MLGAVGATVGGVVSTGVYVATNTDNLTLEGAAGAFVGGAIAGATTAVSAPFGVATAAAANLAGGFAGTAFGGYIANGEVPSAESLALGGALNAVGGYTANRLFPMQGVTSPNQVPYFVPRTVPGLTNWGATNTRALYGGAFSGAAIGSMTYFLEWGTRGSASGSGAGK